MDEMALAPEVVWLGGRAGMLLLLSSRYPTYTSTFKSGTLNR